MGKVSEELKERTKEFALRIIKLARALPKTELGRIICRQLMRCGTSVASNYRAATRGKSTADFIHKMGTVEEEADECMFWIEVIMESELMPRELVEALYTEADEILSITVASIKTAKKQS